jgi:uncharacterized membrane protein
MTACEKRVQTKLLPEIAQISLSRAARHTILRQFAASDRDNMHLTLFIAFFEFSRTAFSMCFALIVFFLIALAAVRTDFTHSSGLDKVVVLSNLCFAVPLAVFGAEHLSAARGISNAVPAYMPWRLFWAYFVGFALVSASLSIATRIEVRWSSLLFGIMMFLFIAMIHFPRALANPHERIPWTIVFREMSFGGAGWILAGKARAGSRGQSRSWLITVGRVLVGITVLFFGVEHFLHPLGMPGVPLEKQMPTWIPARLIIDYLTGAILLLAGTSILLAKKTRMAATYLGSWILLMVIMIYGPVLIVSLADPGTAVKVEGINYFADTLLFAGAILAVASATPRTE